MVSMQITDRLFFLTLETKMLYNEDRSGLTQKSLIST